MSHLYSDDSSRPFEELFAAPGALYRDTPFWAWNCTMDMEQLKRQIAVFQKMGMGGFHMHSRTGMAMPYLQKEFMELVRGCTDEAKRRGMLAWLYDEDRWPSGSAGGIVTKDPRFCARHLEVSFQPLENAPEPERDNSGELVACYLVKLNEEHRLAEYRRCSKAEPAPDGFLKLWCRKMLQAKRSWFNDQTYVDTLNPKAIQRFVEVTHETYFKTVGEEFSKTVPAIFTDEPQFTVKQCLTYASDTTPLTLPYTDDFPETYRQTYGTDFLDTLPELLWERADGEYSLARYRYHDHIAERFAHAFSDTIGTWCKEHNLCNTGHMMEEPTLSSQTRCLSEAMRSYRSFRLPGIDMLCESQELSTAKQAQSASRQFGRGGVLSELDGVTDWDFGFMGHKSHGDWQAALGVTVRVPHLAWVSMAGEAKRDYPASISYQSDWHDKYKIIADHFARVNTAMTRGKALVHVAVIHPIESFWLLWGPQDQTGTARQQAEENFANLFQWLLKGLIDFDLVAESLLPGQAPHVEDRELCIGEMRYRTVVVPPCLTLRSSTMKVLEDFRAAGGDVLFAGDVPALCDASPCTRAAELAAKSRRCAYARAALLDALETSRELRVLDAASALPMDNLLYQMRAEGDRRYLFLCNSARYSTAATVKVMLRGHWQLELLDTASGAISSVTARQDGNWTVLETDVYAHGHLLLRMTPAEASTGLPLPRVPVDEKAIETSILARVHGESLPVTLDEPNVLLLDQAQWRINGGQWQPSEEILRLDNLARAQFGLRPVNGDVVEPWVYPPSKKVHGTLELRYDFTSSCIVKGAQLALEQPEETTVMLDGVELSFQDEGYWTDESIRRMPLPDLRPGEHCLQLLRNYDDRTHIERIYILGDFGVSVAGRRLTMTPPVRTLHWGDITTQGLPFYGGNVTYHASFRLSQSAEVALRMPSRQGSYHSTMCQTTTAKEVDFAAYRGVTLDAAVDGQPAGDLAFAPFVLKLGRLEAGTHTLDLTLYGHRYNAFGSVHAFGRIRWAGPPAYRTEGNLFTYDYYLVPAGILVEPLIVRC